MQKVNVNSSTEGDLVATHDNDKMHGVLHTIYFIEAQGYKIDKNIIYKDNKPDIRLEVNGKRISGKKTKCISSRLFFTTANSKGEGSRCIVLSRREEVV